MSPSRMVSRRLLACVAWQLLLPGVSAASPSLLHPIGVRQPSEEMFPPATGHYIPPVHSRVAGPKATNKFWSNWAVSEGTHKPIYPMPYVLMWGQRQAPELIVSHGRTTHIYGDGKELSKSRIKVYTTPFAGEFALSTVEGAPRGSHAIVKEGLFGVHVEVLGYPGTLHKVTFPVFSGMAYVSGRYQGGFTPRVASQREGGVTIQRVRPGIWTFRNSKNVEFRVYALDAKGEFVGAAYDFDGTGRMNQPLDGWVRLASVSRPEDAAVMDAHAQAVLVGCDLEVEAGGLVRYLFRKDGPQSVPLLHWAYRHHIKFMAAAADGEVPGAVAGLTPIHAPTKGPMSGIAGDSWTLRIDLSSVERLGFLPDWQPSAGRHQYLKHKVTGTAHYFFQHWQATMLRKSYYYSGKGLQKVGMVCLLLEHFYGPGDGMTQQCAGILAKAFKCFYDRTDADDCHGVPEGSFYDQDWGGVPSKQGYHGGASCWTDDFGNACYNDHHYHFGYFVVTAAILVKLQPAYRHEAKLVEFVEALIRDTANPSSEDKYFPQFRSFDWFDLHSWSRGVKASDDGKDQESTSEELNLLWGIHLWGMETGSKTVQKLGQTMLALCAASVREFFLMEHGNPHHHPDFVKNHVTGIFFQNGARYETWFGTKPEKIHGIQMLPLSPALLLTRQPGFCREEWDDIISGLPLSNRDYWTGNLLTGNLAIIEPSRAYDRLFQMRDEHFDSGLSKAWALYWAAALESSLTTSTRTGTSTTFTATSVTTTTTIPTTSTATSTSTATKTVSTTSTVTSATTSTTSTRALRTSTTTGTTTSSAAPTSTAAGAMAAILVIAPTIMLA